MDVVYVNKDGENPELRYSLRSLTHVNHGRVWVFGGAPVWLNTDTVEFRGRAQKRSAYASTRDHIRAACMDPDVSDPFMLWNDDFYAMEPVGTIPVYHRGLLSDALEDFAPLNTPWGKGLRETARLIENSGRENPLFYDIHLPLIVDKMTMLAALGWAKDAQVDAVHLRTLYGSLANPELTQQHPDPKMMHRGDPFPVGSWLSSGSSTFRYVVEPVLRYLFPNPSIYEEDRT